MLVNELSILNVAKEIHTRYSESEQDQSKQSCRVQDVAQAHVERLEQATEALRCLDHPQQSTHSDDSQCRHVEVQVLNKILT